MDAGDLELPLDLGDGYTLSGGKRIGVFVDGVRHRVLRCRVQWEGRQWTIVGRGIKVRPA